MVLGEGNDVYGRKVIGLYCGWPAIFMFCIKLFFFFFLGIHWFSWSTVPIWAEAYRSSLLWRRLSRCQLCTTGGGIWTILALFTITNWQLSWTTRFTNIWTNGSGRIAGMWYLPRYMFWSPEGRLGGSTYGNLLLLLTLIVYAKYMCVFWLNSLKQEFLGEVGFGCYNLQKVN